MQTFPFLYINPGSGGGGFLFLLFVLFYLLPTIIALSKKKANAGAIAVVNFFFGWTVIGWFIALIWAMTQDAKAPTVIVNQMNHDPKADTDTKKCPFCAETIKKEAIKCRYCGASL